MILNIPNDKKKYLPLTGGKLNGNLNMCADDTSIRDFDFGNSAHKILFRAQADGLIYVWDRTLSKNIARFNADGTFEWFGTASGNLPLIGGGTVATNSGDTPVRLKSNTQDCVYLGFVNKSDVVNYIGFDSNGNAEIHGKGDILHTGNVSSYALPLDGGGTVKKEGDTAVIIENTKSGSLSSYIGYKANGTTGYMGFYNGKPYVSGMGEIHHDGNSAKVHIGTTAPSDTSALWIDTSA